MDGGWLLVSFFLVRFALMAWLDREALGRAARFVPMAGRERAAYWVYQLASAGLLIVPFCLEVRPGPLWRFAAGAAVYALGLGLLTGAVVSFTRSSASGFCQRGVYRWFRNPMYGAYFLFFAGCALLTGSVEMICLLLALQVSGHWVVLAEERWCLQRFGEAYRRYQARVRRYL